MLSNRYIGFDSISYFNAHTRNRRLDFTRGRGYNTIE